MTKTSHSKIYSTESGITGGGFFKTHPLHFTKEQLEWIENIQLPKRLFLISATEFEMVLTALKKGRKRKKPPLIKLMMKDSYQSVHLCVLLS